MTRAILTLGIVVLFGLSAGAQQPVAPETPQQESKPPVQPGQLPPPAQPGTPAQAPSVQTPQPQTGHSQNPGQTGNTNQSIKSQTNLVIVPVTVKNRDGQLIGDLQRDEFRIFCDNVEQQIVYFTSDPFPLSAVVLIDNNLSIKSADQVQKSLTAIASGFGPNDEVALVTYDQFPNTVSDFSFNNDLLYTQLKRLDLSSHYPGAPVGGPLTAGATANGRSLETGAPTTLGVQQEKITKDLDDAVYAAGEMLKSRGRDRRKIIFLISDGNNSHSNEHTLDQTLQLLLKSDISVYSISVGHAFLQKESTRLEKYATSTGGDTFYAGSNRGLGNLYASVTEQARNQYTITFQPQDTDRGKDYHSIEVRVRRPNLDVTARQGYYQSGLH
ncbi:MAG: VWA domain-containing protein [Candidatus Acidiferrales bacterium]